MSEPVETLSLAEPLHIGFKIKMWRVACEGFQAHLYYASSRGKALRDAWWGYCNYRPVSFKDFLRISRAWRERPVDGDSFGLPITVNGKSAFFVTRNNQYVRFAWPGSDEIGNVHPYEVLPEHMRPWTYREPAASAVPKADAQPTVPQP